MSLTFGSTLLLRTNEESWWWLPRSGRVGCQPEKKRSIPAITEGKMMTTHSHCMTVHVA